MNVTPSACQPTGRRAAVNSTWTAERRTAKSNWSAGTDDRSQWGRLSDSTPFIHQTKRHTYTHARACTSTFTTACIPVVLLSLKAPIDLFREPGLGSAWPPTELALKNSASTQHKCPKDRWLSDNQISALWRSRRLIVPQQLSSYRMCCQSVNVVDGKMSQERLISRRTAFPALKCVIR